MTKGLRLVSLVALAAVALPSVPARTADHRDAPGVNEDPRADINDIYAFINPNSGNVVLAMTVNPFQIGGGPGIAFGQDVLYEFKIDNDGDDVEDLVVQTTFTPTSTPPQRFNVRGPAKPRLPGTASSLLLEDAPVISGPADGTVVTQGSGNVLKAFAGQRDDPFFFDLIFGFRLLGISPGGPLTRAPGIDFFAGINVSILALELPASALRGRAGDVLRIWGTTGRPKTTVRSGSAYLADTKSGPYVQIDRMAIPVENTVLMPTRLKDAFNRSVPAQDHLFREEAILHLVAINSDRTYSQTLVDAVLFPDVLTLDVSKGSAGFLNGRRPQDDVIDIVLQAASKGAIAGDGVNANDVPFLSDFPFFAPAHDPTKPIPAREKTGNLDSSLDPSHGSNLIREASPLGLPDTLSRAPLRRRASTSAKATVDAPKRLRREGGPFAWLTRGRSFADAGEIRSQSHRPPRPL